MLLQARYPAPPSRSTPTQLVERRRWAVRVALDEGDVALQSHRTVAENRQAVLRVGWGSLLHGASGPLVGRQAQLGRLREQELQELQHVSYLPSDRCRVSSSSSRRVMSRVTIMCWWRSGPSWLRMSRLRVSLASGLIYPPNVNELITISAYFL